jgi:hypothetical protein
MTEEVVGSPYSAPHGAKTMRGALNPVEAPLGPVAPGRRESDVSEHLGESSAGLGVPEKSSRASTSSAGEKRSIILPEKDVVVAKWMFDIEEYDRTIADVSIYRGTNEFQSLINANTIGGLEGATEVDSVIFSAKHDSSENVYLALRNEKKKKLGEGQTTAGRIPSEIVDKLEKDKALPMFQGGRLSSGPWKRFRA